ncbi:hypothetical protein N0V82_004008 [Gnomoniopsis sp. IMI 355080]|nr:hypothetical protein N0V82_004008 [Gnomoniopsis sp. IMI 355080]
MDHWDCRSNTARHYGHVFVAILFFFVAQLLTCAWDQPFWKYGIDFPGQIIAMVFVWLFMWAVQLAFYRPGEGLERVYYRYLKAPTEVLNKHMSIGFTVPFLSLISQSFAGGNQVGLLTTAFVMTGVLNAVFVYAVAYYVQLRLTKLRPRTQRHMEEDVLDGVPRAHADSSPTTRPAPTFGFPRHDTCPSAESGGGIHDRDAFSRLDRFRKHISDVSTLCTLSGYASDCNGPNNVNGEREETNSSPGRPEEALRTLESGTGTCTPEPTYPRRTRITKAISWTKQNICLTLSILIFLFPGLILSSLHATDLPLDVGFLFTVWLTFTSAQTRVKKRLLERHSRRPHQHRKGLAAIGTLLNPVLWTSLALLCYGLAKAHIRAIPAATVVARFKTGTTVSDLIAHHLSTTTSSSSIPLFGAGDLATSILNAGIVSWGLKLFEYRAPLLSRGGLTVLVTSAIAAALNVVAWPLLASRALGVRPPAAALSFAARSVTIALGGPAVARLGGDAGVNAVGVVVNGIVFQLVAGCFVGRGDGGSFCLGRRIERWRARCFGSVYVQRVSSWWRWPDGTTPDEEKNTHRTTQTTLQQQQQQQAGRRHVQRCSSDATHLDDDDDDPRRTPLPSSSPPSPEPVVDDDNGADDDRHHHHQHHHHIRTVAGGVTIGINAAAMGTSHLYEQASGAAAYSALATTVFGVFTVLFTVPSPIVMWLRGMVGA